MLIMQISGYRSYAEFAVTPNLASSPAVVVPFLQDLSKVVRPRADEVLQLFCCDVAISKAWKELFRCHHNLLNLWIHILKRRCNHLQEFNQIRELKLKKRVNKLEDLEPWDEAHYTAIMKSTAYNLDSSASYIFHFFLSFFPTFFLQKIVSTLFLIHIGKVGFFDTIFLFFAYWDSHGYPFPPPNC